MDFRIQFLKINTNFEYSLRFRYAFRLSLAFGPRSGFPARRTGKRRASYFQIFSVDRGVRSSEGSLV